MNKKSELIILDACVILFIFKLGIWDQFIVEYDVILPETIIGESIYIEDPFTLNRTYLNLQKYCDEAKIKSIAVSGISLANLIYELNSRRAPKIDAGELEALEILYNDAENNYLLCTGDGAAVKCATILGLHDKLVALVDLLQSIYRSGGIDHNYSREWMNRKIDDVLFNRNQD